MNIAGLPFAPTILAPGGTMSAVLGFSVEPPSSGRMQCRIRVQSARITGKSAIDNINYTVPGEMRFAGMGPVSPYIEFSCNVLNLTR